MGLGDEAGFADVARIIWIKLRQQRMGQAPDQNALISAGLRIVTAATSGCT